MANILRSLKHFRNFAEFATKLGFSHIKGDVLRVGFLSQEHSAPTLTKYLATRAAATQLTDTQAVATQSEDEFSLEMVLRKADEDIKRSGRVSTVRLRHILNVFLSSESITSTQALMVIRCCGNLVPDELPESRSELVNQVWKKLENSGIQLDLTHYNALLRVYIENEYAFSPAEVLVELERKGLEPNKLTYQRLINRYCQQGDIEGASKILEFMREKGISVNENIFTSLVRGHSEANDMVSAADILSVMRQAGLEPSADTYKELLCGYAKHGDMESIMRTVSECESHGVHLLNTDFLQVIYSLACNGHSEHVEALLSIMPKEVGYLQDALTTILKLVHAGQFAVAMQVLSSLPNRDKGWSGTSVIKQLAQADFPLAEFVDLCKQIQSKGINSEALLTALESTLLQGNVERSLALIQALKESGVEIREHYFWPILIAMGRSKNNTDVINLLRTIKSELHQMISMETLRFYVVPYKTGTPDEILADLSLTGIPTKQIVQAIEDNLITQMKIKEAADFVQLHRFYSNPPVLCRPLVTALAHTEDVESFVAILQHIYTCRPTMQMIRNSNVTNDETILDPYIVDITDFIQDEKFRLLSRVLEMILARDSVISNSCITTLRRKLGNRLTPDLARLLDQLESQNHEFTPLAITDQLPSSPRYSRTERSEGRSYSNQELEIGQKVRHLKLYNQMPILPPLEKIVMELRERGVLFTNAIYTQLLESYIDSDMIDKTEEYLTSLLQKNPEYTMTDTSLILYIALLVKNDRIDDAVQFLQNQLSNRSGKGAWKAGVPEKLLDAVAYLGKPEAVTVIFDMLLENKFLDISVHSLRPLIRVHIVRNDIKEAMSVFEKLYETYKCTPLKNELAKKLIEAEDATTLQHLTDLSTQVHGEANSLYDLAQSFIENNCIRQAKKILEMSALHPRFEKLKLMSERYAKIGETTYSQRLVSVIKDIPFFKAMPEFHENLLYCYDKENNWREGLNLKEQMIEEEVQPSDVFLVTLANLLQRNNQPVEFTVPAGQQYIDARGRERFQVSRRIFSTHQQPLLEIEDDSELHNSNNDSMKKSAFPAKSLDQNIKALVQEGKLQKAFVIVENVLSTDEHPPLKALKLLVSTASRAGEIELLEKLGKNLSLETKRSLHFYDKLCKAYTMVGRSEEYFKILEKDFDVPNASNSAEFSARLPIDHLRQFIQTHPQLLERYTKIAESYAVQGIIKPVFQLWIYHFLNEEQEANKIWSKYLVTAPNLDFRNIFRTIRRRRDVETAKRLIETLRTSPFVTNDVTKTAYSLLIQLYYMNGKYQESVDVLREALTVVPMYKLKVNTIPQMEAYLASKGLTLPANIFSNSQATKTEEHLST